MYAKTVDGSEILPTTVWMYKSTPVVNYGRYSLPTIWVFPKIGVGPQNGWFIRENPIPIHQFMIWGETSPYFWKHPYQLVSCFRRISGSHGTGGRVQLDLRPASGNCKTSPRRCFFFAEIFVGAVLKGGNAMVKHGERKRWG